jgi:glutathione S-transferase
MYHFTALVTCLAIAFYFFTSVQVSQARGAVVRMTMAGA